MNFIMLFDNSSFQPRVLINGKERYVTIVGGIMTLMGIITCLALAGYFIVDFFERKNINIVYSKESSNVLPVNKLLDDFFIFRISDLASGPVDPRIATVVPVLFEIEGGRPVSRDILEFKPCTNTTFAKNYTDLFVDYAIEYEAFNCIDNSKHNLTIFNDISTSSGKYLNMYLAKCTGKTLDGQECFSDEEITNQIQNMRLFYEANYLTNTYDHDNLDEPLTVKVTFDSFSLGLDLFRTFAVTFKSIKYYSDSALIFVDPKLKEGVVFDEVLSNIVYSGQGRKTFIENSFSVVQYNLNGDSGDRYKRTYPKLQQLLANIMGVVNSILMVCSVISQYISYQMMIVDLSNIVIKHVDLDKAEISNLFKIKSGLLKTKTGKFKATELNTIKKAAETTSTTANKPKQKKKPLVKRLSVWEALCCSFCTKVTSAKRLLNPTELILRRQMSVDYFLRLHSEFERLKKIMLNDVQYKNFHQLMRPTIEEHMKTMTVQIKELYMEVDKEDDPVPPLRGDDEVTQRMMKLMNR
jgi:hypothetical protein